MKLKRIDVLVFENDELLYRYNALDGTSITDLTVSEDEQWVIVTNENGEEIERISIKLVRWIRWKQ